MPTHAFMSPRELQRFDRTLALFCPACRRAHQFSAADLSLDAGLAGADRSVRLDDAGDRPGRS